MGALENGESLTKVIEPYAVRLGKLAELTAKLQHPGIQRNSALNVPAQEINEFVCFPNGLANPLKLDDAGEAFQFPANIKIL